MKIDTNTEMTAVSRYEDLSIHQRISLKGLFSSKKERLVLSHRNREESDRALDGVWAAAICWNWRAAINYFFTGDESFLPVDFRVPPRFGH